MNKEDVRDNLFIGSDFLCIQFFLDNKTINTRYEIVNCLFLFSFQKSKPLHPIFATFRHKKEFQVVRILICYLFVYCSAHPTKFQHICAFYLHNKSLTFHDTLLDMARENYNFQSYPLERINKIYFCIILRKYSSFPSNTPVLSKPGLR